MTQDVKKKLEFIGFFTQNSEFEANNPIEKNDKLRQKRPSLDLFFLLRLLPDRRYLYQSLAPVSNPNHSIKLRNKERRACIIHTSHHGS